MRGIVWGKTFEYARNKLTEIINDYVRYYGEDIIEDVQCNKYKYEVHFTNGDCWMVKKASESNCGVRCNISYIDNNISVEIRDNIIRPSTSAGPFTAYNFY